MSKAQLRRDENAILTVLRQKARETMAQEIRLCAGEGLGDAFQSLVAAGRIKTQYRDGVTYYELVQPGDGTAH